MHRIIIIIALSFFSSTILAGIEEKLNGKWGWPVEDIKYNCIGNPHKIQFSTKGNTFTIQFLKPIEKPDGSLSESALYNIISTTDNSITATMEGESRKNKAGELVVWDLILINPNEYTWHRHDWAKNMFTPAVVKCKP